MLPDPRPCAAGCETRVYNPYAMPHPDSPGVRVPPPLYYASGLAAGWLIGRLVPIPFELPASASNWIAAVLLIVAAALGALPISLFVRARTSFLPHRPANSLVIEGPYRFTRNPMYVGMGFLYAGLATLFQWWWALILLPAVLWAIDRIVISREEAYLRRRFGSDYERYCTRVRRWL